MALAKPLHLRLFLEGQEVPVISAQVAANIFAPATAAIQVVPLPEVLNLKPRTMVHLFFLEEPLMRNGESGRVSLADLRRADGADTPFSDEAYKLLFAGEFAGFSYVKTPMSRAVVLQCLDFSSYWDFLQATMLEYGPQGNAFVHRASLYASNTALFADIPGSEPSVRLRQWLLSKPKTPGLENVGGLAGGILAMMEIMGGLRNHSLGVNDFFSLAELRCHLLGQVTAEDGDSTAQRLLDVSVFFDWLFSSLQTQSGQISLRDMFKLLCQYVYYSVVPNPVAKYDPNIKDRPVTVPPRTSKLVKAKDFPAVLGAAQGAVQTLVSSPIEKGAAQNALISIRDTALPKLRAMKGIDPAITKKAEQLVAYLNTLVEMFDDPKLSDPTLKASRVETRRGYTFNVAQTLASKLQDAAEQDVTAAGYKTTVNELSRLRTQIFRPDCYMAPPPTCNVIFPEQYTQFSYDRSLIDEVSRVGILTHIRALNAQDPLLARQFLAPSLWDAAAGVAKQIKSQWRVLMDHELHTGIVAKEEWLPDSFQVRHASTDGMKKVAESTIKWQQRVGMHHFFKYRVGPRTMNLAGRFMPYLVCGFPALVIQEPFYLDGAGSDESLIDRIRSSENPAEELRAPPQFLGMIEGISHSIGQDGGHTQVSMSHARVHLGIDDEFVGLALAKSKARGYSTTVVRHYLTYEQAKKDEKKLAFLRDCTPQADPDPTGDIQVVNKQLTSAEASYQVKSVKDGVETLTTKTVPVKSTKESSKTKAKSPTAESVNPAGKTVRVPSGGTIGPGSKGLYGTVKMIEVRPPEQPVRAEGGRYFQSIVVYEEIRVPSGKSQAVPFEYVVQPDWLSSSYDNEVIGKKVYQPFFGCDSIVDQLQLSNSGQIVPRDPDGTVVLPGEETKALLDRLQKIEAQKGLISIEKAVNVIAWLYGKVRSEHLDVDEFVESFTRRPVATKRDLLGSWDLELEFKSGKPQVKTGTAGFHTFSVHPECVERKNLTGLMDDPSIKLSSSLNKSQRAAMQASYDVRWEKLEMVMKYKHALERGARGFVG